MESRRKLKRIRLVSGLETYDVSTGRLAGHVADITVEGMRITGPAPIGLGELVKLRVVLPAAICGCKDFTVKGLCRWKMDTDNPAIRDMGFQFEDVGPDIVEIIEGLIQRYGRS